MPYFFICALILIIKLKKNKMETIQSKFRVIINWNLITAEQGAAAACETKSLSPKKGPW